MGSRYTGKIEWKVDKCLSDELQDTLNRFEDLGFEVEHYEKVGEQYNGFVWVVIGWKAKI